MGLLDFLSSREKKISNQKLETDISKLCDELTTGIIELSDKAKKLNELKDKYKNSHSELQNSSTKPDSVVANPPASKSIFSNFFGSDEDEAPPPPSPNQPPPDVNSPPAVDNIDGTNSPSAAPDASTALLTSSEQPIGASEDIYNPGESTWSSSDTPPPPPSEASTAPLASSDKSIEPMGASEGIYNTDGDIPPPSSDISPLETLQAPASPGGLEDSSTVRGGKNMKKSKRSKKTIRKTDKKSNKVTKKQKVNNTDDKARSQGLAQAKLQAQGQSMI